MLFLYGADNIRDHSGQLCIAIAIVMIIVFARGALRKGPEALLDLRLFRSGVFPVSARTQFLQNGIVYATQMLLPLYLIKACGRTPGEVGILLLPLGLGMLAGYPSIGWLTKHFGIRNVATGGSLISLLSALPFLYLADHRMVGPIFVMSLLLRGMGQAAIGVPSLSAAYSGVPKQEIPMATTTLNIVQRLGGPTPTTPMAAFLAWRMHFAVSADDVSRAFMLSFLALAVLHTFLLVSTLGLPRLLPKASEVTC